jgi:hypothetical protein
MTRDCKGNEIHEGYTVTWFDEDRPLGVVEKVGESPPSIAIRKSNKFLMSAPAFQLKVLTP